MPGNTLILSRTSMYSVKDVIYIYTVYSQVVLGDIEIFK